jgi:DNA repair exonuclease SbcCD nuclease subunit
MNCPETHVLTLQPQDSPVVYRYAVISDIHLGHRKTPTEEIVEKLRYYVNDSLFSQIDIFVIAGDLYDQLLDLNQDETHEIDFWLFDLLRLAKKHDVIVWIEEGTPLHDREQSKRIITFNEGADFQAHVRYFDKITVHFEPRFNRYFLFVPDEMGAPGEVIKDVRKALAENGIEKVDCAFMHGAFKYQLPDMESIPTHDEASYLELVKHVISIGHVHERTSYERIFAQGSFDRLAHGTEMAKGFNVVTVYENNSFDVTFVENRQAKIYKTISVQSSVVEDALLEIDEAVKPYPDGSHLRLKLNEDHPLLSSMDVVMRRYPGFFWVSKKEKNAVTKTQEASAKTRYVPMVLNEQTLTKHVLDALRLRPDLEERHFKRAEAFLATL